MARGKRATGGRDEPQVQQEEMTVVVLKFKGGSQSLQKGFETVSQALAMLSPAPSNRNRSVQRQPQQLELLPAQGQVIETDAQNFSEQSEADTPAQETSPILDWRPRRI